MRATERSPYSSIMILAVTAMAMSGSLLLYTGGYFYLGTRHLTVDSANGRTVVVKSFRSEWQALVYIPAAMFEDLLTGNGACAAPE